MSNKKHGRKVRASRGFFEREARQDIPLESKPGMEYLDEFNTWQSLNVSIEELQEAMVELGIVLEWHDNDSFSFKMTREQARALAEYCRLHRLR